MRAWFHVVPAEFKRMYQITSQFSGEVGCLCYDAILVNDANFWVVATTDGRFYAEPCDGDPMDIIKMFSSPVSGPVEGTFFDNIRDAVIQTILWFTGVPVQQTFCRPVIVPPAGRDLYDAP
jgi:hypothetical protein